VRNLLTNALDHGEGRPVQLKIAADAHAVAVLVRDHGVGLQPGQQELVFNRFWRGDPSRDRRTGGTGLGLSISLEDARLHGGWLEAWGEPGRGSAFRLTLPRGPGTELTSSPLQLGPDEASPESSGPGPVSANAPVSGDPVLADPVSIEPVSQNGMPGTAAPDPTVPAGPGLQ
jgi:two-component system sensor histidine kinase MtrB